MIFLLKAQHSLPMDGNSRDFLSQFNLPVEEKEKTVPINAERLSGI